MLVITGPQRTPDERGDLIEMSAFLGAALMTDRPTFADVTGLLRMAGWDCCAQALADVGMASAFGWPIKDLPA
ncbi:hypothetical protein ACTFBT_01010 [Streptomyces microflavus]|uniref:Uncharacterized protein n=1 Tax=Streptomyces microflavus TaxID=1919 RepID=A0A7J0D450_STRMI|nr:MULTISPECIES: hypothetical protein [Streptomyces]MDX2978192.1 hypothetical protein [Streptomyces sp. NRRL_B-2249]GFN09513.1 hypothetical protein Smic_80690 [Streptomyces microflavus]GGX67459.1 hypothetical protein GCM10010298_35300 [Streptomyces microflavus]